MTTNTAAFAEATARQEVFRVIGYPLVVIKDRRSETGVIDPGYSCNLET